MHTLRTPYARLAAITAAAAAFALALPAAAQQQNRISITTGGTGGVYYPMGGGMANILSKYVPGLQATAEVTGGSVDNLKLINAGKSEVALLDGRRRVGSVRGHRQVQGQQGQRAHADGALSQQDARGDHRGHRHQQAVRSQGQARVDRLAPAAAPRSWRFACSRPSGIDGKKDIKQERLGVAESVNAIKDRKIDAFFWVGGMPTAAVTDLAATPGIKIKLIDHDEAVDAMNKKYGPLYVKGVIPAGTYAGQDKPNAEVDVWNILVVPATR